ncbi:Ribosomal RNA small subunit methyltransferase H [Candidatus Tremblaya princeps]|uniref:Ribosomal RNA small subunit methyltransferase H n=1 Tax=Tremblaya princeps TaxID=189385 RepID=A0A143WP66_TREPR|nr:Ribosomal RNA small subunit methyltransferase H [Candidatus Tremblaya princeps]
MPSTTISPSHTHRAWHPSWPFLEHQGSSISHTTIVCQACYTTTLDVTKASCCLHTQGMHRAADTFRALRSMANSEPQCLRSLVRQATTVLNPGGGRLLRLVARMVRASIEHASSLILMRTVAPPQREVTTNPGTRSSLLHVLRHTGNPC